MFRELRKELEIEVENPSARLPEVPTEEEIRAFYQQVWQARKFTDMVLIKTLFYTGVRVQHVQQKQARYLFESVRKHTYSDRGVRRMLERYAVAAGITRSLSPHKWRHFLFTWLKAQGVDDALIQPYSGHESRQSLEIYSRLSLGEAQPVYEQTMGTFPIQ